MSHMRSLVMMALLALCGMQASAAELGFYIGGQLGQGQKQSNIGDWDAYASQVYANNLDPIQVSATSTLDDSDTAYAMLAGYRFNRFLAVEGGYANLGTLAYRNRSVGDLEGTPVPLAFNADSSSGGVMVSALGVLPLSYRWETYARIGAVFSSNSVTLFLADDAVAGRSRFSESSIDAVAGVGVSLRFLEIYDARLEVQRVFDAGAESTGEGDLDLVNFGVVVAF